MLKYDFGEVAQVVQSYIINDLCNTYLELVKPTARIAREGEKESPRANISRNVLWYALEQGLRLLHPMMPYITEELWQRLTKPSDSDKSTIMLCAYPVFRKSLQFQDAVESTNKTLAVIGACTKLRAQYKLTNKTRPKCYVITNIDKVSSQVKSQIDDIVSLGRVDEQVEILTDSSSLGASCVEDVVDDTVKIALELKGMIDVDNEIKRYQKKLKKLLPSVEKESENVKKEGIPEKVRVRSKARLEKLVEEKSQLESLIKKFEAFRTG
jgi:valyl-tRNA synthetase